MCESLRSIYIIQLKQVIIHMSTCCLNVGIELTIDQPWRASPPLRQFQTRFPYSVLPRFSASCVKPKFLWYCLYRKPRIVVVSGNMVSDVDDEAVSWKAFFKHHQEGRTADR